MYVPYEYILDFPTIVSDYFIPGLELILIPTIILWFVSWGIIKAILMFKNLSN